MRHIINLDPNFSPNMGGDLLQSPKIFKFPAGEPHVKFEWLTPFPIDDEEIVLTHRLKTMDNVFELILAADAIRGIRSDAKISAFIPYIPFGRDDRAMVSGSPFSLKVFANILNLSNFKKVYCLDPHSDVSAALINGLEAIHPNFLYSVQEFKNKDSVLVAADGGALKKIYKLAQIVGYKGSIYCATKVRDLNNGKILRTTVDLMGESIDGKIAIIPDDICSYGGTFQALAKVLKEVGATKVILVTSHFEGVADEKKLGEFIDKVYTTNSMGDDQSGLVTRFNL